MLSNQGLLNKGRFCISNFARGVSSELRSILQSEYLSQVSTYVTLRLQNVKSTTVAVKGEDPAWEQDFLFETSRLDVGLVIEVWTKGLIWDKALGYHFLPLSWISYSNEEREGEWLSLDAELEMKNGEVVGTKTPTGHCILLDCRFETPFEFGDNEALQEKLELLNTMMLHQDPFQLQDPHQRRLTTMHPTHSEDSDYTSDVSYPIGQHPNSSASQYLNAAAQLQTPQRSLDLSPDYGTSDAPASGGDPLSYNSRPPRPTTTSIPNHLYHEDNQGMEEDRGLSSRRHWGKGNRKPSLERQTTLWDDDAYHQPLPNRDGLEDESTPQSAYPPSSYQYGDGKTEYGYDWQGSWGQTDEQQQHQQQQQQPQQQPQPQPQPQQQSQPQQQQQQQDHYMDEGYRDNGYDVYGYEYGYYDPESGTWNSSDPNAYYDYGEYYNQEYWDENAYNYGEGYDAYGAAYQEEDAPTPKAEYQPDISQKADIGPRADVNQKAGANIKPAYQQATSELRKELGSFFGRLKDDLLKPKLNLMLSQRSFDEAYTNQGSRHNSLTGDSRQNSLAGETRSRQNSLVLESQKSFDGESRGDFSRQGSYMEEEEDLEEEDYDLDEEEMDEDEDPEDEETEDETAVLEGIALDITKRSDIPSEGDRDLALALPPVEKPLGPGPTPDPVPREARHVTFEPQRPKMNARQRWHWAYDKISAQLIRAIKDGESGRNYFQPRKRSRTILTRSVSRDATPEEKPSQAASGVPVCAEARSPGAPQGRIPLREETQARVSLLPQPFSCPYVRSAGCARKPSASVPCECFPSRVAFRRVCILSVASSRLIDCEVKECDLRLAARCMQPRESPPRGFLGASVKLSTVFGFDIEKRAAENGEKKATTPESVPSSSRNIDAK
ncbi:unnamed protein product [Darwinula stevensoni]|uniref:C2 domain-containing protein n=1 Tax=Darwinula stevensoni TaxID=69355 RepID=A0A7R8X229_9CRUS|nr:unnamed protein product [Darwinula stevensoni]CAG0881016.1 unnamed protein product [Darwinula stevensoni]